ncbi:response regulator [Candidatus Nitrosopumilus koreensis AR1]|uniref:Response regulator n=1 Tax=Candidatus Nitrosopumilus koreensis AR1 TaxID=1229908 RepID=K0B9E5_9ARCH|nr:MULTISPECIES: response regulator [Nitrosopumilus]AFS81076.1 response regulator [Candidatus Nitrosopumilus koreensis AR1]
MKLLVVEDEKHTAEAYKIALEHNKHEVTLASTGEDALEKCQKETDATYHSPFDLIILDYKLPKMDGLEVARRILEKNPDQTIVFASAFVKELLTEDIKNITTNGERIEILSKPFDISTLLNKIENHQISQELSEFRIKINPEIIENNIEALKEILTKLKTVESKYLK